MRSHNNHLIKLRLMHVGVQASPARLVHTEDSQRELQEAQAKLQASREGAAAATQEKEAILARCAQLEEDLSKLKVRLSQLLRIATVLTSSSLPWSCKVAQCVLIRPGQSSLPWYLVQSTAAVY